MTDISIKKLRSKKKINWQYPVLVVSRSNKNILAQVIDPVSKNTLFSVVSNSIATGTKSQKAAEVGKKIGQLVNKAKIVKLVFNRNGCLYHGRIKSLVEAVKNENVII